MYPQPTPSVEQRKRDAADILFQACRIAEPLLESLSAKPHVAHTSSDWTGAVLELIREALASVGPVNSNLDLNQSTPDIAGTRVIVVPDDDEKKTCPNCNGTGVSDLDEDGCSLCRGQGRIWA